MAKAVKLADIAQRVGVSSVTVSKALSGQKGVSDELREKIKALADELGYKPPSANKKENGPKYKSHQIGVLIDETYLDKYQSFYWQLYQNVATVAMDYECYSMLEVVNRGDESSKTLPKLIREGMVDGVIIIGKLDAEYMNFVKENISVPMVYLDFCDGAEVCDAVISDSYYGAFHITDYLISKGHEDIAFVGTVLATPSITDRYYGYVKALLSRGIQPRADRQINDRMLNSGDIVDDLLKLPEDMPTAFFCNCDILAGKMIQKLREKGYRVPEDVSVVGYDNYIHPGICDIGITTYEVDQHEMAREAVTILTKRMNNEPYRAGTHIIEGHLIEKESVKNLNPKKEKEN